MGNVISLNLQAREKVDNLTRIVVNLVTMLDPTWSVVASGRVIAMTCQDLVDKPIRDIWFLEEMVKQFAALLKLDCEYSMNHDGIKFWFTETPELDNV